MRSQQDDVLDSYIGTLLEAHAHYNQCHRLPRTTSIEFGGLSILSPVLGLYMVKQDQHDFNHEACSLTFKKTLPEVKTEMVLCLL